MFLRQRIQRIPDATPLAGVTVRVRKQSDGSTITTLTSDSDGWVTWQVDGGVEPFYLSVEEQPGGTKYWSSTDAMTAGVLSLKELPAVLRAAGDGVVRGYASELAVSLVAGGPSVSVAPGAASVVGHPEAFYSGTQFENSRPSSGTRVDRIVIRLNPEGSTTTPGKCVLALLAGTVDAGVPALTQTADLHEVSLARVSVPAAGTITLTDERVFSGERTPATDVVRLASGSTQEESGEAVPGLATTLVLREGTTYLVQAQISATTQGTAGAFALEVDGNLTPYVPNGGDRTTLLGNAHSRETTGGSCLVRVFARRDTMLQSNQWVLQATYGPTSNGLAINTPGQVAVDSTGRILIADTGNNRLVILTSGGVYSTGITGLTSIVGVCVDHSDNIYVHFVDATVNTVRKYTSALATVWTSASSGTSNTPGHLATNGTSVFVVNPKPAGGEAIRKNATTGATDIAIGSGSGSGNGQRSSTVMGIAYGNSEVYLVDAGNDRVQVFNTSGTYQRQWGISANARGIAIDASGDVLVAEYGSDVVKRYTNTGAFIDSFNQTDPSGVAVATGDVVWVSNAGAGTAATWDEVFSDVAFSFTNAVLHVQAIPSS